MRNRKYALFLGVALLGATLGCSNLPRAYCEQGGKCDDLTGLFFDPVPGSSDDSVDVCTVNQETLLAVYRSNSEDICHQIADAFERYMACVAEESCDAFKIDEPECKDEFDDVQDLRNEADNRCNE